MPKLIINLPENVHSTLKELAVKERRSLTNYIICRLEDIANGLLAPITVPGVTPTPVQIPQITQATIPTTQAQATIPTTTTSIPDTSQMTGLEQQEYARKQAAEAKTKMALERQAQKQEQHDKAHALTPEEEQLKAQKLELQKQKMQEKRDALIRDRAIELDLEYAEKYDEDRLLSNYFEDDYIAAKMNEKYDGKINPYTNPPKPLDELYKYMDEIKQIEIEEKAEADRRDTLPHDKDDYDYKSEDFIRDIDRLKDIWVERGTSSTTYEGEHDFDILFNYYFNKGLYHDFELRMNHPDYAFDEFNQNDMQDLSNAFNRDISDIDVLYINYLMEGDGAYYRQSHGMTSYYEDYQKKREEWQRIIDEGNTKKYKTEI